MTPYYQDDQVTLYNGDCLLSDAWLDADVMITDPPYGRSWRQGGLKGARRPGGRPTQRSDARTGIANDESTKTRDAVLAAWGGERPVVMFGDLMLPPPAATKLVGVYQRPPDSGVRGAIGGMRRDLDAIYLLGKWGSGIGGRSSLLTTTHSHVGSPGGIVATSGGHPHSKPLDVLTQLINLTPDESVIADPFAGGGSTLVAAELAGRKAIGVELEERWCEVAARRLSQEVLFIGTEATA